MDRPIPEVFVLWHPDCVLGETLARRIHAWLRPGNGLGPHVFYRSLPAPEAPAGGLPPALPGEVRGTMPASGASGVTNVQVVLLLIDEHLIADAAWRHWVGQLSAAPNPSGRRVFVPVALDSTAFNVPAPLRELNFLRPAGLPLPAAVQGTDSAAAVEIVVRSLLKQLTEAMCRLMLGQRDAAAAQMAVSAGAVEDIAAPKVKIFLSHAKVDGTASAKRIRDYIYSQTQLTAFYDENDIPFGSAFGRVLQSDVHGEQTAALIAVRSARYASRPWCRRELSLFRRPLLENGKVGQAQRWRLNPTLVVDALEGGSLTPGIPELGNSSLIRWSEDVADQEEQIVTTILRDALLAAFHVAVGRTMPDDPDCIILSWLPDPTTLLHIPRVREADEDLRVLYPGRGLSGLELDILDECFPRLAFHSFEAVTS